MSYISAIRQGDQVVVWERHEHGREVKRYPAPYFFYIKDENGKYRSIYGDKLTRLEFDDSQSYYDAKNQHRAKNIELFESDIPPEIKVLSEHYYNVPAPKLHVTFLDIEVDYNPEVGFSSVENPYAPINSIAMYHTWSNRMLVIAVPPDSQYLNTPEADILDSLDKISKLPSDVKVEVKLVPNEKELLIQVLNEIHDSDVLCGWNSDFFDIPYIGKRLEKFSTRAFKMLSFPEADKPKWREVDTVYRKQMTLDPIGRISIDYKALFEKYEMEKRPSYKLEAIADELLPELPKLEYEGSLASLYKRDFLYFIRYNLRDTEILKGFEERLGYVDLANQMCHLSTGLFSHVLGTLKLAELAVVNFCHHDLGGLIVNDTREPSEDRQIKGALVLYPQIGLHSWIGSIDINSLYPSVIRSINISPETLRGQFVEEIAACEAIAASSDEMLTLRLEDSDETETYSAAEWRTILRDRKWAVSGYGTVFDQTKQGIIPAILTNWFAKRKHFQKLKAEAIKEGDKIKETYYDKLQYTYKIKLNSFYGALSNLYFKFFDLRMGESTTGTGRMVLRHQCRTVAKLLEGKYDVDFPQYSTAEDAAERGEETKTALHGPTFGGEFQCKSVIYGDSVTGDTIVETPTGPIKIQELFTNVDYQVNGKEYSNSPNLKVLTYCPKTNTSFFGNVKYVMRHKTTKRLYRIWITNSQYIDVTEDHSLIVYNNTRSRETGSLLREITPVELLEDHASLIHLKTLPRVSDTIPTQFPLELYCLAGYVMGNGYVDHTDTGGILISVGSQDIECVERELLTKLQTMGWISSWSCEPNGHDVQISSVRLRTLLREWLYSAGCKQTPSWMFTSDKDVIRSYLRGWFSADGWVDRYNAIGLTNISQENIKHVQRLLNICGISSIWSTETTENSFNGVYPKRLTIKNKREYLQDIGFIQPRKQIILDQASAKERAISTLDFTLVRPIRIELLPASENYVYDIEIEPTHTFFANNLLVHNTDSTYFKTFAESKEEAIQIADAIAEKVNESYPKFMRKTFLCNEGFDNIIKTGREIVSDNGIFVNKKRYILHLVDLDGNSVDKMKVMGLDTKKTTIPKAVAKELNTYIERFLKGEPWNVIEKDIVDYKQQLLETKDIMSIGLPKGVNGIEDYTMKLKIDKSTRVPGHVMASIFYNQCLESFGDKASPPIVSGMKIKVFYLKQKIGRFKSIAIPADIEEVPNWFLEEFPIDREMHIERLVDNPLQNIIESIGKRVPSKQSLLFDSLLGD